MTQVSATAKQLQRFRHEVGVRSHTVIVDEPRDDGGDDAGPSPEELLASALASCTAITVEMYAQRKGWDVSGLQVGCEFSPAERGHPTHFQLTLRFPSSLDQEQIDRLTVISTRCPVHRTLEGEVVFEERIERI